MQLMKTRMVGLFSALIMLSSAAYGLQGKSGPHVAPIKQGAERIAKATKEGDYAVIADGTYGKVVELMGGRAKMLEQMKSVMAGLKGQGMEITTFTVGNPSEPVSDGSRMFSVVPLSIEMSGQKGKLHSKSYLLAISEDKGKIWKFVDGSGLANKMIKDKILPKMPARLKLPEQQKPVFEPSK